MTVNSIHELFHVDPNPKIRQRKYHHRNRKPLSEETKQKIRETLTGFKQSEIHRQKRIDAITGRTIGPLTRLKMSEAKKGEKHPNWKGGKKPKRRIKVKKVYVQVKPSYNPFKPKKSTAHLHQSRMNYLEPPVQPDGSFTSLDDVIIVTKTMYSPSKPTPSSRPVRTKYKSAP